MSDKKLTERQLLGEQGTALISLAVSDMGCVWRPTSQHDTGVDGEIEIRDSASGAMSGLILKVQSKAVSSFQNESPEGFDYWADPRDVDYWLKHNLPVILVISRPATREVYWQPVQEPNGQIRPKKFKFDKRRDRFTAEAVGRLTELIRVGAPGARGVALSKPERLISNLFPIQSLPERLFLAETPHRTPKDVAAALKDSGLTFEFTLRNKRILTPRDLTDPRYSFLCDRGTVEDFPVDQWSASDNQDDRRDFVALLGQFLRQKLRTSPGRIRFDKESKVLYFPSTKECQPYSYSYKGQKKSTAREVVKELKNKKLGHTMGFRHSAFWAQFYRFAGKWYLEITPTYRFTGPDGIATSRYAPDWLAGIKRLERNNAILGQLVMWEDLLTSEDMFVDTYPYITFGRLMSFDFSRGIDDAAWTASDELSGAVDAELPIGLFDAL